MHFHSSRLLHRHQKPTSNKSFNCFKWWYILQISVVRSQTNSLYFKASHALSMDTKIVFFLFLCSLNRLGAMVVQTFVYLMLILDVFSFKPWTWGNEFMLFRFAFSIAFRWYLTTSGSRELWLGRNWQLDTDEPVEFENYPVEVQVCKKITNRFRGIYRIYPNSMKENRRMSTCVWVNLQTLGSQPVIPKNLPDHW